jgi:hypothetical protein
MGQYFGIGSAYNGLRRLFKKKLKFLVLTTMPLQCVSRVFKGTGAIMPVSWYPLPTQ